MTDSALQAAITALVARLSDGRRDPSARDALLLASLRRQRRQVPPFRRLCDHRGVDGGAALSLFPALPTDVFRHADVTPEAPWATTPAARLFRTSGTTHGARGVHRIGDLSLYDTAARAAGRYALFHEHPRVRILLLAPTAEQAPDSSLSHMLSRFIRWFGDADSGSLWRQPSASDGTSEGDGSENSTGVDIEALHAAVAKARRDGAPVALLGTSFGFVHAEDALRARGDRGLTLPLGSWIMQTGGFKGRSRSLTEGEMLDMLASRYGVPEHRIVQEYGMTELCSQMYQLGLREPRAGRRFWVPGWVRVTAVDPHTLEPLPEGSLGLLRIDDLANLGSVSAIQTSDLARAGEGYLELHGRAPGAVPRGCSLAVEDALAPSSNRGMA